jgi:hypothetical protein
VYYLGTCPTFSGSAPARGGDHGGVRGRGRGCGRRGVDCGDDRGSIRSALPCGQIPPPPKSAHGSKKVILNEAFAK